MRDKEEYDKDSNMYKNGYIYCTKNTYEIFPKIIVYPSNNDLKYLMHENYCLYFKWNEDGIRYLLFKKRY